MAEPVPIQLGLYGGTTEISDVHVVAAHTRILADGSTTFVGEHLRWNRGRQAVPVRTRRLPEAPRNHPSLFEGEPSSPGPAEPTAPPIEPETGEAIEASADQLGLWHVGESAI